MKMRQVSIVLKPAAECAAWMTGGELRAVETGREGVHTSARVVTVALAARPPAPRLRALLSHLATGFRWRATAITCRLTRGARTIPTGLRFCKNRECLRVGDAGPDGCPDCGWLRGVRKLDGEWSAPRSPDGRRGASTTRVFQHERCFIEVLVPPAPPQICLEFACEAEAARQLVAASRRAKRPVELFDPGDAAFAGHDLPAPLVEATSQWLREASAVRIEEVAAGAPPPDPEGPAEPCWVVIDEVTPSDTRWWTESVEAEAPATCAGEPVRLAAKDVRGPQASGACSARVRNTLLPGSTLTADLTPREQRQLTMRGLVPPGERAPVSVSVYRCAELEGLTGAACE